MLSITNSFKPIDKHCADTLAKIELLVNSETFLAGLGDHSEKFTVSANYNVIDNFERALYLTESQEMWDEDDSDDLHFPILLHEIIPYYGEPILDYDDSVSRRDTLEVHSINEDFMDALTAHINYVLEKQNVFKSMRKKFFDIEKDRIEAYVNHSIHNTTWTCISQFFVSAYYGGMDKWPVCKYFFECFNEGAFPCGWVGDFPEDLSQPYTLKNLQVLHFGPQQVL